MDSVDQNCTGHSTDLERAFVYPGYKRASGGHTGRTGVGEYAAFLNIIAATVSILTFVSGMFIMVGFFTKIAAYIQITIILLGIAFILSTGIERNSFEMISTVIILLLLVFVANKGSGSISFDDVIKRSRM